jgi:hypothetical protein
MVRRRSCVVSNHETTRLILPDGARTPLLGMKGIFRSIIRKGMPSGLTRGWVPVFPRDKRQKPLDKLAMELERSAMI